MTVPRLKTTTTLMPGCGAACRPRPAKRRGRMPLPLLTTVLACHGARSSSGPAGPGCSRRWPRERFARLRCRPPRASAPASDGTPEQVHLTWGNDPATSVVVSWASPGRAVRPRVLLDRGAGGREVVSAHTRSYTDGLNGETVWTYHAVVTGLRPDTGYSYVVTADNPRNGATPVRGSVRTAPAGRVPFRFTSFGDLATPNTQWVLSYGQSAYAVRAVESFQPLFHLLNGDLCYADLNPAVQPEVWRDFGNNNQASAAFRPWMPCPGNHEIEFDNGPQGYTSYLTRYLLPDNGVPRFRGHWYSFQVGSALFVSLDADDVVYQDARPAGVRPGGADARGQHRQPGHRAGHLALHPRLQRRSADRLAAPDPGRGPRRPLGGLDHRLDAPGRGVLVGHR